MSMKLRNFIMQLALIAPIKIEHDLLYKENNCPQCKTWSLYLIVLYTCNLTYKVHNDLAS